MKKKKQTLTVKVDTKPRAFELNQTLVRKGHQVHARSERKLSRDRRRAEVFVGHGSGIPHRDSSAMTHDKGRSMAIAKNAKPTPLVLVNNLGEGSIRYARYEKRESTHVIDATEPLVASDVEFFRTKPEKFYEAVGIVPEEASGAPSAA